MIDIAVNHLGEHANEFLKRNFQLNEDILIVSNVVEQDGNLVAHVNNKLLMFLVNIEQDSFPGRTANINLTAERREKRQRPLYFNLYIMIAACFSGNNYAEALKFLSQIISFFQRQPVFDHHNTPDLDDRIDKLTVEIENMSLHDLSNLWGMLSGKYLPSVLYKVRMITFDSSDITEQVPTFKEPAPSLSKV